MMLQQRITSSYIQKLIRTKLRSERFAKAYLNALYQAVGNTSKKNEKFPYKINIQIQGRMITFNAAVSVFPVLVLFLDFFGFGLGISGLVDITEYCR